MTQKTAKVISFIFHPVILPALGFLLLLNTGLYDFLLSGQAKRYLLLVIFFTTATLPMLSIAMLALNPKFDFLMRERRDRIMPLLFATVFYYIGFVLLSRIHFLPVFKLFMIASVLLIVALLLISVKWNISIHMAAAGAVTATLFAISFRGGVNPTGALVVMVLVSGITGTAQLLLEKNDLKQLLAGYLLGFIVLYPVIYFF
jgi:hypothetical protein